MDDNKAAVRAEPLSPVTQQEQTAARIEKLRAEDPQFRDSFPLEAIAAAKRQPGLRLPQVVRIVMEGYADRPALGQRARELRTDPTTGRRTLRLLPSFDTLTYRELWARSRAVASDWHHDSKYPLTAGDFVCILGFASPDYATPGLRHAHIGVHPPWRGRGAAANERSYSPTRGNHRRD
jgi:fatty acid CoA ligase FadD9